MAAFWVIWTFICLGITGWDVHSAVHYGTSPAWIVIAGGSTLLSILMIHLTWPR